jgi:hypothetical protein
MFHLVVLSLTMMVKGISFHSYWRQPAGFISFGSDKLKEWIGGYEYRVLE